MYELLIKLISFLGQNGDLKCQNWRETAKFIMLVDQWFDLFNSSVVSDTKQSKNGYSSSAEQLLVLSEMITFMQSSLISNNKKLLPFQKGVIINCKSLQSLYKCLSEMYGVKYILTKNLNQDVFEHFFGMIRQTGAGHCYPCSDFKNRQEP